MKTSNISNIIFAAIAMLLISFSTTAQEYLLNSETNGTTITTCSGTLYDSGGAEGNYQNSENYTVTLCSEDEGSRISLHFTQHNTEQCCDGITVFDGNSTSSPMLAGPGGSLTDQTFTASSSCLTIRFESDGSVTYPGFAVEISCAFACQDFNVDLIGIDAPFLYPDSLMTDLCQGEEFTLSATASFPNNDIHYNQSLESLNWHWVFMSGSNSTELTTGNVNEITHSFNSGGYKLISIYAEDANGCISMFPEKISLRVSVTPDFSMSTIPDEICLGEQVTLFPVINIDTAWIANATTGITNVICFEDVVGVWQSANLEFLQSNSSLQVTQASDIESVCLNMEHSYIGDLNIKIVCPNGQTAILFEQACSGSYFGEPNHSDDCVPGIGYDYCWSMSATSLMSENCNSGTTLAAGSYLPVESFDNLIGCPLNGEWLISFMDNLGLDDGNVFSGAINFAPEFYNPSSQLQYFVNTYDTSPESDDFTWTGTGVDPGVFSQTIYPDAIGEFNYNLSITDNFGCSYNNTFTVNVFGEGSPACGPFCNSMVFETPTDTINDGSGDYFSQDNTTCDWTISLPSKSLEDLFLYWNYFDVYEGDVLSIYAGNSDQAPLLFEFTGNDEIPESFVIPGNQAFITYTTDGTLRSPGWELVYQTVPTQSPSLNLSEIKIFPNPANESITISGLKEIANINITDMSGRVLFMESEFENGTIDISEFAAGVYLVNISNSSLTKSMKIIKK